MVQELWQGYYAWYFRWHFRWHWRGPNAFYRIGYRVVNQWARRTYFHLNRGRYAHLFSEQQALVGDMVRGDATPAQARRRRALNWQLGYGSLSRAARVPRPPSSVERVTHAR